MDRTPTHFRLLLGTEAQRGLCGCQCPRHCGIWLEQTQRCKQALESHCSSLGSSVTQLCRICGSLSFLCLPSQLSSPGTKWSYAAIPFSIFKFRGESTKMLLWTFKSVFCKISFVVICFFAIYVGGLGSATVSCLWESFLVEGESRDLQLTCLHRWDSPNYPMLAH